MKYNEKLYRIGKFLFKRFGNTMYVQEYVEYLKDREYQDQASMYFFGEQETLIYHELQQAFYDFMDITDWINTKIEEAGQ